jgi:YebC/PmpR family DNA-binding regulatory protein
MSGHSHAKTVKRVKEASDKKRGQTFSKLARLIIIAVKEGGESPETNPKLRAVIEAAKNSNMPKENIERAILRGAGKIAGEKLEEFIFEAYGPGGIAILIEGITDNKNRAISEVKQVLSKHGGKMVGEGGVRWLFERTVKQPGVMEWTAKQLIEVDEKTRLVCKELFAVLDDLDSVQKVYSNLKENA